MSHVRQAIGLQDLPSTRDVIVSAGFAGFRGGGVASAPGELSELRTDRSIVPGTDVVCFDYSILGRRVGERAFAPPPDSDELDPRRDLYADADHRDLYADADHPEQVAVFLPDHHPRSRGWPTGCPSRRVRSAGRGRSAWLTERTSTVQHQVIGPTVDSTEKQFDFVVVVLDQWIGERTGWMGSRSYTDYWDAETTGVMSDTRMCARWVVDGGPDRRRPHRLPAIGPHRRATRRCSLLPQIQIACHLMRAVAGPSRDTPARMNQCARCLLRAYSGPGLSGPGRRGRSSLDTNTAA